MPQTLDRQIEVLVVPVGEIRYCPNADECFKRVEPIVKGPLGFGQRGLKSRPKNCPAV